MTNYEKLCETAGIKAIFYPAFTAEKQIELIKLIKQNCDGYASFSLDYDRLHYFSERFGIYGKHYEDDNADFTEALVGLTLKLIEAGELEKDEVRRILK